MTNKKPTCTSFRTRFKKSPGYPCWMQDCNLQSVTLKILKLHASTQKIAEIGRNCLKLPPIAWNYKSQENCKNCDAQFNSISPMFTNFRRNLPVFKQGVRLNFTDFHQLSSKLASFQIRSAPQFHRCSQIFVETCQFSNKERASISPLFTNFRRNLPVFK